MNNRITKLYGIRYPIIQGGMIWCSGWELASAVSNAGGLGLIGSGSMDPDTLRHHIRRCREATDKPFGVNVPLIYSHTEEHIQVILQEKIKIVFTSAGNPKSWTGVLKEAGVAVAHVVANRRFALKCVEAGVDAIVAEGFEAGGHNGIEETTTMTLIPLIREAVKLPLIAAGGIATGRSMLAAMALGAEGVQMGSRFVLSEESSAHPAFKEAVAAAGDGETRLMLKKLVPVRLLNNPFARKVFEAEMNGAGKEELSNLLGRGRARKGMFDGDLEQGELEIGQVSAFLSKMKPAGEIINDIVNEYNQALKDLNPL
ncbi:MAG: nitronate monooxygenase [Bacteroidales bacterium]